MLKEQSISDRVAVEGTVEKDIKTGTHEWNTDPISVNIVSLFFPVNALLTDACMRLTKSTHCVHGYK